MIRHLTPEEVRDEAEAFLSIGYGDIELVAATDKRLLRAENAVQYIIAAREAGAENIGINFFPYGSSSDYRLFSQNGCTFNIVWQETYNPVIYKAMHAGGPKANMKRRLDAHDYAAQGGMNILGVAFLGGLYDWRFDAIATIEHALYLRGNYQAKIIFGMPRWKPGAGSPLKAAKTLYGDEAYKFIGALYSLALPQDSLVWFSTREEFNVSADCARGGGCLFTLDCSTEVGGYTKGGGFEQFPVYSYALKEGKKKLIRLGFNPQINLPWRKEAIMKTVETKLFYKDDLWDKIVKCPSYELAGRELKALQRIIPLAARQAPTPANIIHLGVGDGREIQTIVNCMAVREYLLNDINCHLLRRTAKGARTNFPSVEFREVCMDIETSGNIGVLRNKLTGPTIIVLVNNGVIFSNRSLDKEIYQG